jgi:hypothetical protein
MQHGHMYNSDTRERIILAEGVNYFLITDKEENIEIDNFAPPKRLKSKQEIFDALVAEPKVTHVKKLFDKGKELYFFIELQNQKGVLKQSRFKIQLLEDLFLYSRNDWKQKELISLGKLAECECVVHESEFDSLPFFENIFAKSISSACKRTHIHYFGNDGSPSKNAFDSIYISTNKSKQNLIEKLRGFTETDRIR